MSVLETGTPDVVASALKTIDVERDALAFLREALTRDPLRAGFERAIRAIQGCRGRLIVTGMGKSGLIARKIAATMTSTGTPSLYLHPAEASHGDLGMVTGDDIVLALSWSGETPELSSIISYCRRFDILLLVMTSRQESTAAQAADIVLLLPPAQEACPNQLAPTSSTTMQVVLGDALAVALVQARGFSRTDFLNLHPGGRLGAQLTKVSEVMGHGSAVPRVGTDATIEEAIVEMSRKRYGSTAVVDGKGVLVGAFTDGDLRRSFVSQSPDAKVVDFMTPQPLFVAASTLTSDALRIMNSAAIAMLFVCDDDRRLIGALHLHDLLRTGLA